MKNKKKILITIDVEDWFQVENLKKWIPFETWGQHELRVERNVHKLLDLFDSVKLLPKPNQNLRLLEKNIPCKSNLPKVNSTSYVADAKKTIRKVKATFFVLGWIAQRLPGLVREIHARGHEIASHGINHRLSNGLNRSLLAEEMSGSKKMLEDITGSQVFGFRAPSFAIDKKVLKAAQLAGYTYDSSFNSFSIHRRYGKIDLSNCEVIDIAYKLSDNFYELPVSNFKFVGQSIPWGGGAYFRFIPFIIFMQGIRKIFRKYHSYLFYMHPWEIDPEQPRIGKPLSAGFIKHYHNQKQTLNNLKKMICSFSKLNFITCRDYIDGLP
jgi:peptidoglycan-N-acetylglucosamine deacetylase